MIFRIFSYITPMKRILFSLIILNLGFAETILIPEDFGTIQEGIDISQDGDTVLVADGTYIENLILNKSIVLASHAIYDDLTNWVEYDDQFTFEWQITNDHINNTIIDGSSPADSVYASVILITPDSEICITPEVMGFTIQNGGGTQVALTDNEGNEYQERLGGGILADISDPFIHYNKISNNGSVISTTRLGGGGYFTRVSEDWDYN